MSDTVYIILLIVGVPAISIVGLCLAICVTSGRCSRKEEAELDLLCYGALEADLRNFNSVNGRPHP
ncbi:hypothetical protein LPB79_13080 [Rhizobium sp. T136]|uniref:hypothetical protein n=1 Tax=Rhizobium sp. T136 TaxID=555319 RepID=UPI001E5A4B2E|nr:hypothetical protein [Rhizobium sp. T136]UFS83180.1 hypothetical protein LPB79_13080 [Rhizobium sp. T136]